MNAVIEKISMLLKHPFVSGKEALVLPDCFCAEKDEIGNLILRKKGKGKNKKTVLFEAHLDEIGLCITEVLEGGFLKATPCGGLSPDSVPGSVFEVHGKKKITAVGAFLPPHLKKLRDQKSDIEILLDTGILTKKELSSLVSVGDVATFEPRLLSLRGDRICSRGLDNRASVCALLLAYESIQETENDLIFLFSVGEETGSRGARAFCSAESVDVAVILDAGFAHQEGLDPGRCIRCEEGPSVSYTDTLSLKAIDWVVKAARDKNLPLQILAEPGGTGTSATATQITGGGIPSVVVSIPVFNMHSASEIVSCRDIADTVRLIRALADSKDLPPKEVNVLAL
ncbi:MAG: M20/M25/M40 family metallo-hydrolase [Clostridia bacterium]|nr:M20/M25/M40 family metallo-hydrolase [Clostridia bacterium]